MKPTIIKEHKELQSKIVSVIPGETVEIVPPQKKHIQLKEIIDLVTEESIKNVRAGLITDEMIEEEAKRLCAVAHKASRSFSYYDSPWDEQTDDGRKVWRAVAKAALSKLGGYIEE